MEAEIAKVTQFHHAVHAPIGSEPALLATNSADARKLACQLRGLLAETLSLVAGGDPLIARVRMSLEETAEWVEAHADGNLIAAADAWADRCYVLLGDAVASGLPASELFNAVHESNMTKAQVRGGDGKAAKAEAYKSPRIEAVLSHASSVS